MFLVKFNDDIQGTYQRFNQLINNGNKLNDNWSSKRDTFK